MTLDEQRQPPSREEAEPPAGELRRRCSLCRGEIQSRFYLLREVPVCVPCGENVEQRQRGRGRLRRGLLSGGATALLCALAWVAATAVSGRPLLALTLVAGAAIGLGVHLGSGRHGGWRFQLVAVLLVYGTFVGRYVPPVFGGMAEAIRREHAGASSTAATATATTATTAATTTAATATGATDGGAGRTSAWATLKAYFVFTVVAWGLVLGAPFLPGTASAWGLLALGAGMALAFRLNRRVRIEGPYDSP